MLLHNCVDCAHFAVSELSLWPPWTEIQKWGNNQKGTVKMGVVSRNVPRLKMCIQVNSHYWGPLWKSALRNSGQQND